MKTKFHQSRNVMAAIITFVGCENTTITAESPPNETDGIIASRSSWHWKCPTCKLLNAPWRSKCAGCQGDYSSNYNEVIHTFIDIIKTTLEFTSTIYDSEPAENQVELPDGRFLKYGPQPWYNESAAKNVYTMMKNSSIHGSNEEFQEGYEFA